VRIGEAPVEVITPRLEQAIKTGGTGVRLAAAEVWLGKADKQRAPSFFELIGDVEHLGVGEPLRYGRLLGKVDGLATETVDSYIKKRNAPVAARLTALGYYYAYGTNEQSARVKIAEGDTQKVPKCEEGDPLCNWVCSEHQVATVGDFLRWCVEPHMTERKAPPEGGSAVKNAADTTPKASQGADKRE
jgi:hypothetical protein